MTRRSKIIIAVIVVILLVLIALLFLLKPGAAPTPQPGDDVYANANVNGGTSLSNTVKPPPDAIINGGGNTNGAVPPQADDRTALRNTARSFAEMFGSFSTEGNFENLVDAQYYMSPTVKAWAEQNVKEQRAKPQTGEFAGTTTRAIFEPDVQVYDKEAGIATVVVKTRRIETGATIGNQNVYYQDLTLDFVKISDAWKVNRFTWGPK